MPLQLHHDEYQLFLALPEDGSSVGNGAARVRLNWSRPRYGRAREGLLEKQLVTRGIGRGGTLRRAAIAEDSEVSVDTINGIATLATPVAESKLYAPILETLRGAWSENRGFEVLAIEDIANQGGRRTGGKWTRPDLVAVGIKDYKYVPHRQFEIVTFEVKPASQINVLAVYEALSHLRSATHAYVLIQVPAVLTENLQNSIRTVEEAANDHGIGVIEFDDASDFETWNERLPAERKDSNPQQMNDFIEKQLSIVGQQTIADTVRLRRRPYRDDPEVEGAEGVGQNGQT